MSQMFHEQNNKTAILKMALELFSKKGLGESTVDEIVKISNTSKGTFYHYFKSKNQLFLELLETGVDFLISEIDKRMNENNQHDAFEHLKMLVDAQVDLFIENPHFFKLMISEVWRLEEIWHEGVQDIRKKYLQYVTDILKESQHKRLLRQDVSIELMGPALFGMIGNVCMHQIMVSNEPINTTEVKRAVYSAFFNGVLASPLLNE